MKILILGSRGMLGSVMATYLSRHHDVSGFTREDFDPVVDSIEIISGCDVVINCIGVIKPTIDKYSVEDVIKINSIFPKNLANFCESNNVRCFHVTTDCVYSGSIGNYNERSVIDAEDLYGLSKAAGEPLNAMVLRTSIIGEEQGTQRSLLEWVKTQRNKTINGYTNHSWNGVTTLMLADIVEQILRRDLYGHGIFHIHSRETVSKYELVSMIADAYDLNIVVEPVEAPSPCNRVLTNITRLNDMLNILPLKEQLKLIVDL